MQTRITHVAKITRVRHDTIRITKDENTSLSILSTPHFPSSALQSPFSRSPLSTDYSIQPQNWVGGLLSAQLEEPRRFRHSWQRRPSNGYHNDVGLSSQTACRIGCSWQFAHFDASPAWLIDCRWLPTTFMPPRSLSTAKPEAFHRL